ncbi:ATP-binding protein [Bordetella genomosp. 11]|nr:ATP-binding protein [Bordetella genomosp. 11]
MRITTYGRHRAYWRLALKVDLAMAPRSDTLRLIPGHDSVSPAMQWLEAIAEREQWPERTRFALALAMDEALTNVLTHAFAGSIPVSGSPTVELAYHRDATDLCVEIADNGRAFDPTAWSPASLPHTLEDATPGGQGLRLMRHYLKDLRYRRDGGWNRLTLVAGHG